MLTSLMLGFVISTRFFVVGGVLLAVMLLYLIFRHNYKRFLSFIMYLPLSLVVLLFAHTKTIQNGYSIIQIFGVQKYILFYHKSKFILPFSFWDLFLFNRWHTWWGSYAISFDSQWIFAWPFTAFATGVYAVSAIFKKIQFSEPEKIVLLWVIAYSLMLSVGYTSTRYFLPLIPFFYILGTVFIVKLIRLVLKYKFNK